MSLILFESNRIEYLAEEFNSILTKSPLSNPFDKEKVLISSVGIERFLNLFIAQNSGIAANIEYGNISAFFWKLIHQKFPYLSDKNVYSSSSLLWRILNILDDKNFNIEMLNPYLSSFKSAHYELSSIMADLFNQYLIYRPDWIEKWSKDKEVGLGKDEKWQMKLWQEIQKQTDIPHKVMLLYELKQHLKTMNYLPKRIFLFSINSLAPLYLDLLKELSNYCDVYILALNPCCEYWGDVLSERVRRKFIRKSQNNEDDLLHLYSDAPPLLASLGQQGRDFFASLSDISISQGRFDEEKSNISLLERLQYDIQMFRQPEKQTIDEKDKSIVLHCSYSPLRELHALKDEIIDFLAQPENSDCTVDDIAVLTPSIEEYAPFIDAVFSQGKIVLPFSIADTEIAKCSVYLQAWTLLLKLCVSRFERELVFELFDNTCITKKFELNQNDINICRQIIEHIGVYWGWGSEERKEYGNEIYDNNDLFTWTKALNRIIASLMLPNSEDFYQDILPCDIDISLLPVLQKIAKLLETLAVFKDEWQENANLDTWINRIHRVNQYLLDTTSDFATETFLQAIKTWHQEGQIANKRELSLSTVIKHINTLLNSPSTHGFMRGGVTFGSLVPLRSLSFKFLALIGMNNDSFPRRSRKIPFDLMSKYGRAGDRSRRQDDRYLFLESIMSARKKLYLSYVGRDIRKNDELAPSELIWELGDVLSEMTGVDYWEKYKVEHPLQYFSERYFTDSGSLKTYRSDYAEILSQMPENVPAFMSKNKDNNIKLEQENFITLENFLKFWKNPIRFWLNNKLEWNSPYLKNEDNLREPFFDVYQSDVVCQTYIDARKNQVDENKVYQQLMAQNLLPTGYVGEILHKQNLSNVNAIPLELFPSNNNENKKFSINIKCDKNIQINLSGCLKQKINNNKRICLYNKTPKFIPQISDYLEHLINCVVFDNPLKTYIIYPDKDGKFKHVSFAIIAKEEALDILAKWCKYYIKGQDTPLDFINNIHLMLLSKFISNKNKKDDEELFKILFNEATKQWEQIIQKKYYEIKTIWRDERDNPIVNETSEFWILFEELIKPMSNIIIEEK